MNSLEVYSLGAPGTFSTPEGCLMPWTERFSYECSMNLYLMSQAGFTLSQNESTELDSLGSFYTTLISDFQSWYDSFIDAAKLRDGEIVRYTPPSLATVLPSVLAAFVSGNWPLALVYLVTYAAQVAISRGLDNLDDVVAPGQESGNVEAVLRELFADEDNGNLPFMAEIRDVFDRVSNWSLTVEDTLGKTVTYRSDGVVEGV